jgi:hypothetical protein
LLLLSGCGRREKKSVWSEMIHLWTSRMDHDGPNRLDNWGRIISLRIIFGPLLRLFVPDRENPLVTVPEQAHVAIAVDVANDCTDRGCTVLA